MELHQVFLVIRNIQSNSEIDRQTISIKTSLKGNYKSKGTKILWNLKRHTYLLFLYRRWFKVSTSFESFYKSFDNPTSREWSLRENQLSVLTKT